MLRKILPLFILCVPSIVCAQVGIGTKDPAASSRIEISSTDKGVLFPRLVLESADDKTTITGALVESLFVYNTGSTSLQAGYYYWNGAKWVRLVDSGSTSTLAGDVTGALGANTIGSLQGSILSIGTPDANNILTFNGTAWVSAAIDDLVTGAIEAKDLTADASITVNNGTGALLSAADIQVASAGITGTHIAAEAVATTHLAQSTLANQVLVSGADKKAKWSTISELGASPWLVQGGTNVAVSNAENIYQMGKVAIGVNTIPTIENTAKLYVEGDVVTTGKYFTSNAVYADYVFEKYFTGNSNIDDSYSFKSLSDVAEFIEENHHLPGVTSIDALSKSEYGYGFDLTSLSVELLEKVEELFLHTIEQQKIIDELRAAQSSINSRLELLEKKHSNN